MSDKLTDIFKFGVALKVKPTEGNLVYEYNPFFNYRLDRTMYFYKNRLMEPYELLDDLKIKYNEGGSTDDRNNNALEILKGMTSWNGIIPKSETPPVIYQKGQLVDFETNELHFSLNNPVNILPQYSYDNSVNLIINDGINPPRLINSRFSATERNKYQICDRKGNNDSNIYDQGNQFDIDTSLYKKIVNIPELQFSGVGYGGNLKVGNYHFYFRYVDDDGNESDFFAESGLVSIFIGNAADSIHSGFREENSNKLVKFILSNTDPSYQEVLIYYTKATSDINQNATVSAYKLNRKFKLSDSGSTLLTISGYEEVDEVDISEINPTYQIYGSAETQDQCQNILFMANVDRPKLPYEDFADCALRFLPCIDLSTKYHPEQIQEDYSGPVSNTYYDPMYIYNTVGYHQDEIYRLGIVFILSDNTLSDVYNVRGTAELSESTKDYTKEDFYIKDKPGVRNYLNFDEQYYNIVQKGETSHMLLENAKGVIKTPRKGFTDVVGINFHVDKEVIEYLVNTLGIKGFFFVRQKRIPTTLCQAYTIGIDKESHTPIVPSSSDTYWAESFLSDYSLTKKTTPFGVTIGSESSESRVLTHDRAKRMRELKTYEASDMSIGAICPEYDVNSPYLNSLFTGSEFSIIEEQSGLNLVADNDKRSFVSPIPSTNGNSLTTAKIIGVEDNVKLVAIGNQMFSARAGEAEEAFRYEYLGQEKISKEAANLVRGAYGPYLGITGYKQPKSLISIKIPGYSEGNMQEYFEIRFHDKSPYYPISYRIDLQKMKKWIVEETDSSYRLKNPLYRGDCYICQFTHRINRNFQDPSAPTNDKIVDKNCWKNNYDVSDGVVKKENFEKINLGDVNAVKLGMYITLYVRSSINLNIRSLDDSIPDEIALTGHARGYYPYYSMSNSGAYKTPEALCYNKGFEKSVSEKIAFEVPDVPWIKNEFSNRISYSKIQVNDAFENGWRTFPGTQYRDYPKTYGSITKLVELRGNLLCVFEHGVALIPINERAIAGEGSGGNIYINTSNVLPENPKVISDIFGSQWRESIVKTPRGVYGVDTVAKKIWRTNGEEFECISDFRIQEFLNQNISLTERELDPIIGVRNVKSHYNRFKGDVMFTFYDNLYGFEEKVWNICFNETLQKWITFYSWVPSYSENIYNQYFSFDRNTSKWIAKLGTSKKGNDFSDGVVITENVIPNDAKSGYKIGDLDLANRTLPSGDGITISKEFELVEDNFGNKKNFEIKDNQLYLKTDATNLCSEFFVRGTKSGNKYNEIITDPKNQKEDWINNCVLHSNYSICKNDRGKRINLDVYPNDKRVNGSQPVILLNIKCNIKVNYTGTEQTLGEAYASGVTNGTVVDAGYYQSVVAVVPKYNMQFLTTDFWKHGQAGIIDIADKIYPTYWYGKQHPFEFEFVVADNPQLHKIFDDLEIISNKAAPESFHYEIVGQCYDFAKDKKNMYIRQEATKDLYQQNGFDVLYDHNYDDLESKHRELIDSDGNRVGNLYDKSTLFPLYYSRRDSFNEVEDFYHMKDNVPSKDFSALSGGEIVRYENLDEYRIWNHARAIDLQDSGRMRGNMQYKEDKWNVQINPLNIVQKNEPEWVDLDGNRTSKIPVELGQSPIPNEVLTDENGDPKSDLKIPDSFYKDGNSEGRGYTVWKWDESKMDEVKLKDKFVKIRIRYSGEDLAIISAIKTLYSASYS